MEHPRLSDYDYALPPELIAQFPAARRSDSRLLRVRGGGRLGAVNVQTAPFPGFPLSMPSLSCPPTICLRGRGRGCSSGLTN